MVPAFSKCRSGDWLLAAGIFGALLACTASTQAPQPGAVTKTFSAPDQSRELPEQLVEATRSLLASPYRVSGSDPRGFDCSGFTSYVFRTVGLKLPRTAQAQASAGRWVAPDDLQEGDLVFFGQTREKLFHVGLVVSEAGESLRMIHASSSRGVIETDVLRNPYWLARLRFGRRVLD